MENCAGFFVACDLLFLNAELIKELLNGFEGFDVVCAGTGSCGSFFTHLQQKLH
jgi:molybdopterin-guanine dinucleotide biosynthesis protein A